uniref:Reverse transcriptase n=1 Tax=Cyprinus carpio TaxID=7962 RepID=A0A8C1GFK0_CYPCA
RDRGLSRDLVGLRSMYSKLKSFVKGTDGLTEYFGCTIGVRQGCMVSPLLFNLFLNNEYITILNNNCKGIQTETQSVGNIRTFIAILNQRLKEKAHEAWYSSVLENNKLNIISQCKSSLIQESYIASMYNMQLVRPLFLFRCSTHHLAIETGRWSNTPIAERICSYCKLTSNISVIEDEKHFLYDCSLYKDLRK